MVRENLESELKTLERLEAIDLDHEYCSTRLHLAEEGLDADTLVSPIVNDKMEHYLIGAVQLARRLFDKLNASSEPTERLWSQQLPEVAGWYWWRRDAKSEAEILRVDYFGGSRLDSGIYFWRVGENLPSPVENLSNGEWCAIVEPEIGSGGMTKQDSTGRMAPSSQLLQIDEASQKHA